MSGGCSSGGCCSASWPGSAGSSWFVELPRGLCLVLGLVRLLDLTLVVVLRGSDASTGRMSASSHQHVFEARGDLLELGKDRGSRRLDPARSRWSPGPNSLKTTRGGEVRDRFWVSAHLSLRAEVRIKGISHHFLRVCVCAYECPWARLTSRKLLSACVVFALHYIIDIGCRLFARVLSPIPIHSLLACLCSNKCPPLLNVTCSLRPFLTLTAMKR